MSSRPRRAASAPLAKTSRPAPGPAILRHRLFENLDAARSVPVIWVSGPAGSGKTTLLSTYVKSRGLPCLWYQVDSGDADLASFFHYLALGARALAPISRERFPALTPEYRLGLSQFSRNFFETLGGALPEGAVMALDNLHEVPDEAMLYKAILDGLSRLPSGTTVILMSRSEPPASLSGLAANGQMERVDWRDLRLTREESAEILEAAGLEETEDDALDRIYVRTDGWAAGIRLFLEASRGGVVDLREFSASTPEQVGRYFAGQVLGRKRPEVQEFLLKTSLLPVITPAAAEALTGYAGAADTLAELHRENTFTNRRGLNQPTYEYHPLFRGFLEARARERFSQEELGGLERKAAAILSDSGLVEEAASLMLRCGAREDLTNLVLRQAPAMLRQGRNQTLLGWIQRMPKEALDRSPWLHFWMGSCLFPVEALEAGLAFQVQDCFAHRGMERAGVLDQYECGIFERIEGWFDAMGVKYSVMPELSRCLRFRGQECRVTVRLEFP